MSIAAWLCAAGVWAMTGAADTGLLAGAARASITPLEAGLPTQLGGYGDRAGKPAEGVHDTLWAKALVFDFGGEKSAVLTLDVCHAPGCVLEESVARAAVPGLTPERVLMPASHTHAGLEGMMLDRRNVAGNPHIGVFNGEVLDFVTDRIAGALKEAAAGLGPVTAGAAVEALPGMNRNRRDASLPTDNDMTVLRFDRDGKPWAVFVNYTAHGTIMTPEIMLASGGWPGVMQRAVEEMMPGVLCLYANGAEGDVAPAGYTGGSRWEMAQQYGFRAALAAARIAGAAPTAPVARFSLRQQWVDLPAKTPAPDFLKIAGDEYKVTEEQLGLLLEALFPARAPLGLWRVNDFALMTFPGEPITAVGAAAKGLLRDGGAKFPAVAALTNDHIGYILTADEYAKSGYEVTASFYGPGLADTLLAAAEKLAKAK